MGGSLVVARAAAYRMPAGSHLQLDTLRVLCTVSHVIGSLCGGIVKAASWWGCAWAKLRMLCVVVRSSCGGLSDGWSDARCERTLWGVMGVRGHARGVCKARSLFSRSELELGHRSMMS